MRETDKSTSTSQSTSRRASASGKSLSRSQEVRARHQGKSQVSNTSSPTSRNSKATNRVLKSYRYAAPSRPVLVRGTISPLPMQKKQPNRPHRRLHFSLGSNGAEFSLPVLFSNVSILRVLVGLVIIGIFAAVIALFTLPTFKVSAAQISGNQRITTDEINQVLQASGTPVLLIHKHALQAKLLAAFPDLSSVSISIGLPAQLKVNVVERTPALAWVQGDTTLWIDTQGYSFPVRGKTSAKLVTVDSTVSLNTQAASSSATASSTPVASTSATTANTSTATSNQPALSANLVNAILALSTKAPTGVPLLYDGNHGLGWKDPNGWQVYFGSDVSDITLKISEYQAIVSTLKQQGITPALISVEFPHAPFYRLEQ